MSESGSTDMDIPQAARTAAREAVMSSGSYSDGQWVEGWSGDFATAALEAAFPHLRPLFQHATEIGRELGRREALDEVFALIDDDTPDCACEDCECDRREFARNVRNLASPAAPARSDGLSGSGVGTGDTEGGEGL